MSNSFVSLLVAISKLQPTLPPVNPYAVVFYSVIVILVAALIVGVIATIRDR